MKKMKKLNKFIYYILLVFIASFINTGCQDVDVENFNDPDLETTLKSSDDYPDILSGAYLSWWDATHKYSPYMTLSVAGNHGSSSWGNFNMREVGTVSDPYGLGNHKPLNNTQSAPSTAYLEVPFYDLYSAISTANDVLKGINTDGNLVNNSQITTDNTAFQAYVIRGLSYGYLALLYDQGFVITEETDLLTVKGEALVTSPNILAQAISDLDKALSISTTVDVDISQFNGLNMPKAMAVRLVNSYAAKFLALHPRSVEESNSLDWGKVKTYAENGITETFAPLGDGGTNWWHAYNLHSNSGWIRVDQQIINMIDSNQPYPFPDSGTYTVDFSTIPDNRLGETDSGAYFEFAGAPPFRANRGIYFYSFFKFNKYSDYPSDFTLPMPSMTAAENDLLIAESIVRTSGDLTTATDLINKTRVTIGGLNPATISDTDLLEKILYERYLEAYEGPGNPFFDRRRTGTLGQKQFTQFPLPALELNTLGLPLYTFGG